MTQLEEAIAQLFQPQGRNIPDTALLYFSGHGLRKNTGISEGFLATSDVNPDLGNWGIRLKWLRELLQESPVRQQIIILDCCYSGELLNFDEADPGDRGKGRDRCFIAASREFEVAYEGIGSHHSVLSEALLQGLDPKNNRARLSSAKFIGADLSGTDFSYAKDLTPEQVKSAKNWEKAIYDEDFRKKLGLPPQK
ncbi:MAG: caspase family protein [Nostocaceae cyanobacterium]|nr:caspase family protein [Nostocaceae cyanobacterium]